VVGGDQAFRRDEAGGATAQRHHRVHRRLRQVGERGRVALVPCGAELFGDGRQLRGQPHAFAAQVVGGLRRRGGQRERRGQRGNGEGGLLVSHAVVPFPRA